jgi:DNA-binding HxlR family transcriptional regulator
MKLEKVTEPKMTDGHGRWYGDACGAALGMELLGERWAGLVLRELMLGARRFTDLRFALPGISARVLTERLTGFEASGLVRKEGDRLYGLTPWGRAVEPILIGMCRWALMSPDRDMSLALSPVSLMLSLKALIVPEKAGAMDMRGTITIGRESFTVQLQGGALSIERGDGQGDFTLTVPNTAPLKSFIYGKAPLATLPEVVLTGDAYTAMMFARCFALPPQVTSGQAETSAAS